MQDIKNILMLSCKKATEIIDKKSVSKLTMREKLMLKVHTSICDACKNYEKQSSFLDSILKNHFHQTEDNVPQISNEELKSKIIKSIS